MPRPLRPTLAAALLAAVLAPAGPAAAQQLSAVEQRIADHVDSRADEAVELLERTVNINSGTMNPEGVRRVAEVMRPEFEALGFDVTWLPLPDSVNRAGHLVARRSGSRGRSLLLIGHLDTVFEEDSPFQRFERDGDTATGPGVADMKSGNVIILHALEALHAAGALDGASITVVLTGDEESPGDPVSVARRALIDAAKDSDVALGFEGGSRDGETEYAVIARRSSSGWTLTTGGRRAHSSGVFSDGVGAGAVFEAARILDGFYEELAEQRYLTFNPGVIVGGTDVAFDELESRGTAFGKTNVVAQRVVVNGGIRTISNEQLESARAAMREIAAEHRPHTSAELTFSDGYPAMPPTDGNRELLEVYDAASRVLGYGPIEPFDPARRGAADISFAAPYVDAALGGLGAYGSGSHSVEERLELSSMPKATKRAAIFMYRLTREAPGTE